MLIKNADGTVTIDHGNGHSTTYREVNGTSYDILTPDAVVRVLESVRQSGRRVRLYYGDVVTGRSWGDEFGMAGTIARSMGPVRIPILIETARSFGGGGLLDACIIKIRDTHKPYSILYIHPLFNTPVRELVVPSDLPEYAASVTADGGVEARFRTVRAAQRYIDQLS
jgi:hypothetical protein